MAAICDISAAKIEYAKKLKVAFAEVRDHWNFVHFKAEEGAQEGGAKTDHSMPCTKMPGSIPRRAVRWCDVLTRNSHSSPSTTLVANFEPYSCTAGSKHEAVRQNEMRRVGGRERWYRTVHVFLPSASGHPPGL